MGKFKYVPFDIDFGSCSFDFEHEQPTDHLRCKNCGQKYEMVKSCKKVEFKWKQMTMEHTQKRIKFVPELRLGRCLDCSHHLLKKLEEQYVRAMVLDRPKEHIAQKIEKLENKMRNIVIK